MFKTDKLPKLDGRQSEVPISDKSQALVCAGQLAFSGPVCSPEHLQTSLYPSQSGSSHSILPSRPEPKHCGIISTATRLQDRFDA